MRKGLLLLSVVSASVGACNQSADEKHPLTVFAAASMTDVLSEIGRAFERESGFSLRFNFGASSALARQIESGAPCDVFVSANRRWIEYLEQQELLASESRRPVCSNRLVLIAPLRRMFEASAARAFKIAGAFSGRIVLADPDYVPAGIYARQSLESLGWWSELRDRVVPALDVRGALRLVESADADAGIVYHTDARASDLVGIVLTFPSDSHDPIQYLAAARRGALSGADRLLDYLNSETAREIFARHGFSR